MFNDDKHNHGEKAQRMQKYFFVSFAISFVLLLFATLMCMTMHDFQFTYVQKYFPIEEEDFNYMVILLLGIWKILIFQFTLIPAIAIMLMRKCCKC